jgi:hypothetical protein
MRGKDAQEQYDPTSLNTFNASPFTRMAGTRGQISSITSITEYYTLHSN